MKRTRVMIAVMLLAALLVSGCALAMAAEEEAVPEEEAQAQLADPYPFQDFPAKAPQQQAAGGQVTQTKVQTDLFKAKFEGDTVSGSGGAVGGKFHFIATETDGESWHVKLEANYPTISGRDYAVTYNFTSDVAGTVKFGDFQEFQIQEGENSVTGTFTAKDSTSYLDLQLGMLPAFTIDFTDIQVKEYADEVTYENALPAPVNFQRESRVYERHDTGYETVLVRGDNAININYEAIPLDLGVWKSKLYVRTGLVPEQGTHYRVTADVMVDRYERNIPFELLLNDGDIEKGYGALYGQQLVPGEVKTCEAVITGNGNGDELILQFSLGEARGGSLIIVGNVHVDKIIDQYTNVLPEGFALDQSVVTGAIIDEPVPVAYENIPLSPSFYSGVEAVYEQHDDGYIVDLKEGSSSATMAITQAPSNPDDRGVWKAKLYAATGVTLNPGTDYRLQFDLDSEGNQADYEICFDGNVENAYGALYGRSLTAGGTDHVDMILNPEKSDGPLTVRFQLGKTDTASGNTVTLRNFSLEAVDLEYTNVLPDGFAYRTASVDPSDKYVSVLPKSFTYDTNKNVSEEHDNGYTQSVSDDGKSATLTITEAPKDVRDVWNSKLFINTGITPKVGQKYVVTFDIEGKKDQETYEVCYDGDAGEAYGKLLDKALTGGKKQTISHSFTSKKNNGPLVLRFQLGKTDDASGNTIKVSNIQIKPVTSTPTSMGDIDYTDGVNVRETHGDGVEQSVTTTDDTVELKVTQARTDGGVWSSCLLVDTGVTPAAGKRYRVIADVASEKAINGFEVLAQNSAASDNYAGAYELTVAAEDHETVTMDFTAPDTCGDMVLLFQLGNTPADNTITVSDIQVCELGGETMVEVPLKDFAYPVTTEPGLQKNSFDLWTGEGAEAELSGDGNSATATVTKPGDGWHVKLYAKPGLTLEAGESYKVTMDVANADGCKACFKSLAVDGEEGFGSTTVSGGKVEWAINPDGENAGELEVVLEIGGVDADTAVTVSNLKITKSVVDYSSIMPSGFAYPVTTPGSSTTVPEQTEAKVVNVSASLDPYDGFEGAASASGGTATLTVNTARSGGGLWSARFFVGTGVTPVAGETYRVSANLHSVQPIDEFEVLYSNGVAENDDFNHWGKGYNDGDYQLSVGADGTYSVYKEFTAPEDLAQYNELFMRFQIGNSPADNTITVSDVSVVKVVPAHEETTPASTENNSFDLYVNENAAAELTGDGSSATATVTKPGEGWHVKLYAKPGLTLEAGESYKVTMDVANADGCKACFKSLAVDGEEGFGSTTVSGGKVEWAINPDGENAGELEVVLELGGVDADTAVTVSNIDVEKNMPVDQDVTPEGFAYPTFTPGGTDYNSFDLYVHENAGAALTGDGTSATATVTTPADGWQVKLYAKPGLTLEAGESYKVTMDVANADGCKACFKSLAVEGEEGFGWTTVSGGKVEWAINPTDENAGELEVVLEVGKVAEGTAVTASNLKIEKLDEEPGENLMTAALRAWAPVNFWAHDDYRATLTNNETSAQLTMVKAPAEGREAWKTKLFFETGYKLEAGKSYRISADVKASDEFTYEICYNNGAVEKDLGALYDLTAKKVVQTETFDVTPDAEKELIIQFSLGNAKKDTVVTVSNVKVEELKEKTGKNIMTDALSSWAPVHHWADHGYKTTITNNSSSATLSFVSVPSDRADWQTKLFVETGAELKAGKSYRITYNIKADKSFDYNVFYNNGAEEKAVGEFYDLKAGSAQTVQHIVSPGKDAVLNIQLMLGRSAAKNKVTISGVKVEEIVGAGSAAHPPINFWAHEDYAAKLSNTKDSASIAITKAPAEGREPWKVKLFAETYAKLAAGKTYRISVDVKATDSMDYEICYNNAGSEAELGSKWGLQAGTSKKTFSYTTTPEQDAELTLQFNLGNATAGTTFTISNVKVEEVTYASSKNVIPGFSYNNVGYLSKASDPDYITSLDKHGSSADFHIWQAPAERHAWCAKVVVRTGINPTPGMGYRISFNLDADSEQNLFELFCDGNEELAYGALYEKHLDAGSNFITFTTPPCESKGPLQLQLRFGETNSTSGNHYHISDFTIEEVTFVQGRVEVKEAVENDTQDGYAADLTRTPDKATLRLVQTPTEGLEAWKNKLFVYTGAVLEPGQKYRISFNTKSIIPTPFEICFNNHNEEKGLGGIFGLTAVPTGYYTEYYPNVKENTPLVIQLSLGNCTTPNTIFLSDVKVEKAGKVNLVSDTVYSF